MWKVVNGMLVAVLLIVAGAVSAEDDAEAKAAQEKRVADYFTLMKVSGRAGMALEMLTDWDSLTAALADDPARRALVRARLAYDPSTRPWVGAGAMFYHLAWPLALKSTFDNGGDWFAVQLLEKRLIWLSGDRARARRETEELLAQVKEWDWGDEYLASALADLWLMAEHDGDGDAAAAYLARARACAPDCRDDVLKTTLRLVRQAERRGNPADIATEADVLAWAVEDARRLFGEGSAVIPGIEAEGRLWDPDGREVEIAGLMARLERADGAESTAERAELRHFIRRFATQWHFLGDFAEADKSSLVFLQLEDDMQAADLQSLATIAIDYAFKEDSFRFPAAEQVAALSAMISAVGTDGERIAARVLAARMAWSVSDVAGALTLTRQALSEAQAAGIADARLGSVLADGWVLSLLAGDTEAAEAFRRRLDACVARASCGDDILAALIETWRRQSLDLPATRGDIPFVAEFAGRFADAHGQNRAKLLAQVFDHAAGMNEQSHPVDAAEYARQSAAHFLAAIDGGADAVAIAEDMSSLLDTLVLAGRYYDAIDIAQKVAARVPERDLGVWFLRMWARALFHVDDPDAERVYGLTVDAFLALDNPYVPEELVLDLLDTTYLDLLDRLLDRTEGFTDARARLRYRQGRPAEAAEILAASRLSWIAQSQKDWLGPIFQAILDRHRDMGTPDGIAMAAGALAALERDTAYRPDHPVVTGKYFVAGMMWQEAFYRAAAGQSGEAARLRELAGQTEWVTPPEVPLVAIPRPAKWNDDSYDRIRHVIAYRDAGNYEGAAHVLRNYARNVTYAEEHGAYVDAQTLWQMAFTFARAGDQAIAFDLMSRAARIASNRSFDEAGGADGGSLQLLERDRWRYLLFIDIAWGSVTGRTPEDMLVVSRY
jgi:hypothetical protein